LGNWLLLSLLVSLLAGVGDSLFVTWGQISLDFGVFATITLALLCRVVGTIVAEGARAAAENRGFV
jgi:hypothetical protein